MPDDEAGSCPIPATHDKLDEAHFFLHMMGGMYHDPDAFRWNMNAFLQALRSVTFMLQAEPTKPDAFEAWYAKVQVKLQQDLLLRKFHDARTTVVHKGMLQRKSRAFMGLFKHGKPKLGMQTEVSPFIDTKTLFDLALQHYVGLFIDAEHSAIGEQIGVERLWIVEEIGDSEILGLCFDAWARITNVVVEAHNLYGRHENPEFTCRHHVDTLRVILETDLDPTLPEKWGW